MKVSTHFRLAPDVKAKLVRLSRETGLPSTTLVEMAIRLLELKQAVSLSANA